VADIESAAEATIARRSGEFWTPIDNRLARAQRRSVRVLRAIACSLLSARQNIRHRLGVPLPPFLPCKPPR